MREDSRRKCGELVVVKRVNVEGVKKEGMKMEWKREMEVSEGREISEYGRGKGGKTVVMKKLRKRGMKRE